MQLGQILKLGNVDGPEMFFSGLFKTDFMSFGHFKQMQMEHTHEIS